MESFLARKLGEASVFYTACYFYHIQWTHFLTTGIGYGSSTLGTQSWERTPNIKSLKFVLRVPFSWPRSILLVVERTSYHPVCLPLFFFRKKFLKQTFLFTFKVSSSILYPFVKEEECTQDRACGGFQNFYKMGRMLKKGEQL